MELKFLSSILFDSANIRSNRTFMELKSLLGEEPLRIERF